MDNSNFVGGNDITGFVSYILSIDWSDPWLCCLVAFHILTFSFILFSKNRMNFQVPLFLILLFMVYFSEDLNAFAAKNFQMFSRQQYFDSQGFFISIVFSMPILLNSMLIVGNWLIQSTQLMTKLKRDQLRERVRQEKSSGRLKKE